MTLALRPRRVPHPRFPAFDSSARLETREHAATALGAFYEHVTAALVGGHRVRVDRAHGQPNPDVVAGDWWFESKATASARWVLNREQHDAYAARPRVAYVCWAYTSPPHPLAEFPTVRALQDWCASHVRHVYVIAADLVRPILGVRRGHPRYSNRRWGWNYFLPEARVRQVLAGNAHRDPIPRRTHVVRDTVCPGVRVGDVDVAAFPVTWILPMSYFVSAHDQALAAAALAELDRDHLVVTLIPSSQPGATHKIRCVESRNPRWYEIYHERRLHAPGARGSKRRRARPPGRRRFVRAALELLAAGRALSGPQWTGWELLELLREAEEREVRRG